MYFFTADEHYSHTNIIKYSNRPFKNIEEMDRCIIDNHNSIVGKNDIVIHAGDFCFLKNRKEVYNRYIRKLNGEHIFLKGSHDYWIPPINIQIWEKLIEKIYVVVCHYSMRTWARNHYNSWQLYGHSHGRLEPIGKQWDIGVDNNNYFPVSWEQLKEIMKNRPDNPNLIRKNK